MSAADALVLIGTASLSVLAGLTYFIASTNGYRRYGREALFVAVGIYSMLVGIRVARDVLSLMTGPEAIQIASATYAAALLILAQIAFILRNAKLRE